MTATSTNRRASSRLVALVTATVVAATGALVGVTAPAYADPVFHVTGTVLGLTTDGTSPLENVEVTAEASPASEVTAAAVTTTTAVDGTFTLDVPAEGDYTIAYNYDGSHPEFVAEFLGHTRAAAESTIVTLDASEPTATADFVLDAASTVSGVVTDATGNPVEGATVEANRPGQSTGTSDVTDATGTYTIEGVPSGPIYVSSSFTSTAPLESRVFYARSYLGGGTSEQSATPITVELGSTVIGQDFSLQQLSSVRARVVDSDGNGIAGIALGYAIVDPATDTFGAVQPSSSYGTDSNGWFAFASPATESFAVVFADERLRADDDRGAPLARAADYDTEWFDDSPTRTGATRLASTAQAPAIELGTVALATAPSGAPHLTGTLMIAPVPGDSTTLAIDDSYSFSPAAASTSRQWLRDGTPIVGQTGTHYALSQDDKGSAITVAVTATSASDPDQSTTATSNSIAVASDPFVSAPTPTITGTPLVGEVLTGSTGTWSPTPNFSYRWLRDGAAIGGATGPSYTLTADDFGATITFEVRGALRGYTTTIRTSAPTDAIIGTQDGATPTIAGTPRVGQSLSSQTGAWMPALEGAEFSYQWSRARSDIAGGAPVPIDGATAASYALTTADLGFTITVAVTGQRAGYQSLTKVSASSNVVIAASTTPVVSGTRRYKSTLTVVQPTWATNYTYQWLSSDPQNPEIAGATNAAYTLTSADIGWSISVRVVGTTEGYPAETVVSLPTAAIGKAVFTSTPTISAIKVDPGSLLVGKRLKPVISGSWGSESATTLRIEWRVDGNPVAAGPNDIYTITQADLRKFISVSVTGSREFYDDATKVSQSVGPVVLPLASPSSIPAPSLPPLETGPPTMGSELTANFGNWGDVQSRLTFTYQWVRNNDVGSVSIPGATNQLYTPTVADVGAILSVRITASSQEYEQVTKTSLTTATVKGIFANVSAPGITGEVALGETLTARPGSWTPAPTSYSYQWKRNGVAISGATSSTYTLMPEDGAANISVQVVAKLADYLNSAPATSESVLPIGEFTTRPRPTITGTARVGARLSAVAGKWDPTPTLFTYEWRSSANSQLVLSTASTYTPVAADRGRTISVKATAVRENFTSATSTSSVSTAAVAYGVLGAKTPTITGSRKVAQTLTAVPGNWGTGVGFTYKWLRDGTTISGATSVTYKLSGSDYKKRISVTVRGSKSGYTSTSKTSAASGAIAAGTLTPVPTPTVTGTLKVGAKLTAVPGTWGPGTVTRTYQWYVNGSAVSKATSSTFTVPSSARGDRVTVRVVGKKTGYTSTSRTSAAVRIAS